MADSSNGSTFTFAAANQADVRSITYAENGNPIDVTVLGSANHFYELGVPDITATIEVVGVSSVALGDAGAVAIAWNDGSSEAYDSMICVSKDVTGSLDSELTTSLEFKPDDPTAAS